MHIHQDMSVADLERSIDQGHPVLVVGQAWRGPEEAGKPWSQVEQAGHYMVVIGYDERSLFLEDPDMLGSQGSIPKSEFVDRWHDWDRDGNYFHHMGIVADAAVPPPRPPITYIP